MKKIKVLWFTNTSSNYKPDDNIYNGGGWYSSLEKELNAKINIKLAISFFGQGEPFNSEINGVSYYPISINQSLKSKLKRFRNDKEQYKSYISEMLNIVNDFNPDLIHIFGSEQMFGLLSLYSKIPIIIHMQGLMNPNLNTFFPPSYSLFDLLLKDKFFLKNFNNYKGFKKAAKTENVILSNCKFFMGRTEWDYRISKLYSPNSKYFYCSEILRKEFYLCKPWNNRNLGKVIQITSTISSPMYKGADLILKTAQILKTKTNLNFEWNVFGINDMNLAEKKTGINSKEVSVQVKGVISSTDLCDYLTKSHCFFHSSYIDNSPNSICEAQIIGVPVISTNVGGISSLIEHKKSGLLFPSNDPYSGASLIIQIVDDPKFSQNISNNSRRIALKRHNKDIIIKDLMKAYKSIID